MVKNEKNKDKSLDLEEKKNEDLNEENEENEENEDLNEENEDLKSKKQIKKPNKWLVAKKRASDEVPEGHAKIEIKKSKRSKKEDPLSKAIRMIIETGNFDFGTRKGIKNALLGKSKLIIISKNCEKMTKEGIIKYCNLSNINLLFYDGSSKKLGSVCGRPFPISILSVYDVGNSSIMEFAK